jgi:hypothetical protein
MLLEVGRGCQPPFAVVEDEARTRAATAQE